MPSMSKPMLKEIISKGEGISQEFKSCHTNINRDVYETVCAFLNRHGGTIFLGVSDTGEITGIAPYAVSQIKKDFVTAVNNPQKINPTCYLSIIEEQIDHKTILRIYIPESSQVHRCNNRIFDRNEDGDIDITDNTRLVGSLYYRKQASYTENKIYPHTSLNDLRRDLISRCRKIATRQRANHPWDNMDDLDLIKSAQLHQTNPETGESGITLAGILLLGKDRVILSALPHHRTDLILRKVNIDRYDDRDLVTTNLIESYERIMAFVAKHLPDPFFLEGDNRISLRDTIFREIASNILIHREYLNAFPAKLIIEQRQIRTENSNKPHGSGQINPATFSPFPKNPVIARFFREIGRADELGSGVRNLMKYGKLFSNSNPQMIEGDIFKIIVQCPDSMAHTAAQPRSYEKELSESEQSVPSLSQVCPKSVPSDLFIQLINISCDPTSAETLMKAAGQHNRTRFRRNILRPLLDNGILEMTIPHKPSSSKQKYKITSKGLALLKKI